MMRAPVFSAFALAFVTFSAASTSAQAVGSKLPPVGLEGFSQTPAKGFEDYAGRAVMFEFFAYWCGPCAASVPHVNEIQEKWGAKGLSVIGVTDESVSLTEPWISANKAEYAYAYDKGGKLSRYFGVDSIPRAVVIGADGTVLYNGHPMELKDEVLAKAVNGALAKPMWEWSGAGKGVKGALLKRDYKGALDLATKLTPADSGPEILAAVQAMVKSKVENLRSARARGDYLGAQSAASALQKELVGLPEADEAAKVVAELAADPKALEVIKGQQKLAKIEAKEPGKKKELQAAIDDLHKLQKEYPGTYVDTAANELIQRFTEQLGKDK